VLNDVVRSRQDDLIKFSGEFLGGQFLQVCYRVHDSLGLSSKNGESLRAAQVFRVS
jgi:hypothetical protein